MTFALLPWLRENWLLLVIPLSAAIVGHAAGQLLRGTKGGRTPPATSKEMEETCNDGDRAD